MAHWAHLWPHYRDLWAWLTSHSRNIGQYNESHFKEALETKTLMLALPYQMDRPLEAQKETNSLLPRAFPEVAQVAPIELPMLGDPCSTLKWSALHWQCRGKWFHRLQDVD